MKCFIQLFSSNLKSVVSEVPLQNILTWEPGYEKKPLLSHRGLRAGSEPRMKFVQKHYCVFNLKPRLRHELGNAS